MYHSEIYQTIYLDKWMDLLGIKKLIFITRSTSAALSDDVKNDQNDTKVWSIIIKIMWKAATAALNQLKNQSFDFLPIDSTRVKLPLLDDQVVMIMRINDNGDHEINYYDPDNHDDFE